MIVKFCAHFVHKKLGPDRCNTEQKDYINIDESKAGAENAENNRDIY